MLPWKPASVITRESFSASSNFAACWLCPCMPIWPVLSTLKRSSQVPSGKRAVASSRMLSMLSILEDATARLPDGTWLERFSVDNTGQIGMQGQSQQAAKLLDALKDSRVITDAGFQGSIQPDQSTGKERFYLTARVKQPAALKTTPAAAGTAGAP